MDVYFYCGLKSFKSGLLNGITQFQEGMKTQMSIIVTLLIAVLAGLWQDRAISAKTYCGGAPLEFCGR